ncbi:MAG: crotonase [Chloroflexi bacterium]|nr:crotonase [Chloroflexota bacterium]
MSYENILYEKKDNVAWITLNRPQVLNSQNFALMTELTSALEQASADDEVRAIVITGAGEKAFSAGADINMFLAWSPVDAMLWSKMTKRPYEFIRDIPKPVIAMVNGLALGGGCEVAMACDIIIASDNASFGQPEVNVGVIPGAGGTQILPRLVGEKKAKELIFTCDRISAKEAYERGLVNKVVPPDKLKETVLEVIAKIVSKSPVIMKLAKLAINRSLEVPLSMGMQNEGEFFGFCFSTQDQKEGAKAFLEKRAPKYTGK